MSSTPRYPDFPAAFRQRMTALLKEKSSAFFEALDRPPITAIRRNSRRKTDTLEVATPVSWLPEGGYLNERPVFTLDPQFHAGAYYVQEASSMFLGYAMRQLFGEKPEIRVLDLCAAPGGKSTLLASLLGAGGLLWANEVVKDRAAILAENLQRWGVPNVLVSRNDPADFEHLEGAFDLVVVDAPCSGEGLFRKEPDWREQWTEENVAHCSARQKRILAEAIRLVRPGGVLIYSTCTWAPEENEANVSWLANQAELSGLDIAIDSDFGIATDRLSVQDESFPVYRFYPHRVAGEGFFLAAFRKEDGPEFRMSKRDKKSRLDWKRLGPKETTAFSSWFQPEEPVVYYTNPESQLWAIPAAHESFWILAKNRMRVFYQGVLLGKWNGKQLIPQHTLAMSHWLSDDVKSVELDREEALKYLAKADISTKAGVQGWAVVRHQGNPLGWAKFLPNRVNNYLPKALRIRMNINPSAS